MNRQLYFLAIFCLLLTTGAGAQLAIPKKAYWHLTGNAGGNITISLNLVKMNDSLYADCSLFSPGNTNEGFMQETFKPYDYCGTMDSQGNFELHPFGEEFPCFRGQLLNAGTFSGEFAAAKTRKAVKFELNESNKAGGVQFNVYSLQQSINLVKKAKSPKGQLKMALLFPMGSGNPVISDTLRGIILRAFGNTGNKTDTPDSVLNGNFRAFKRDYLSGNEDLYRQMPDAGLLNWDLLRYMHIVCNESYILSFYILNYAFTGGAHGLESLDYFTVDIKTGTVLKLEDLLVQGKKPELSSLLTKKLKLMNKIPLPQKLTDNGYFTDDIQPNENFYLTPYGIGFLYNHYDIAPYSFGATDIFLTADEVRDIIRPVFNGF